MKYLLYILFFVTTIGQAQKVSEVRTQYGSLEKDKVATQALYDRLKDVSEEKTLLSGYKGAVLMLQAKHIKGIKNKKKLFKEGALLLEQSIQEKPENIELRTLRLSVQENAPKILKYNKQIEEDKAFIIAAYSTTKSKSVRDFVNGFVQQSSNFTAVEKTFF